MSSYPFSIVIIVRDYKQVLCFEEAAYIYNLTLSEY